MPRSALMRFLIFSIIVFVAVLLGANTADLSPFPSLWDQSILWIFDQQRAFHRELAQHLRGLETGATASTAWALVAASFLYGVFHAAGPGHGKAVIATYLLTHENHLKRGILLAAASSLVQGAVAILLVTGLLVVAGWLPQQAQTAVTWSERSSFALLACMGAIFTFRSLGAMFQRPTRAHAHEHHPHHHGASCGCSHGPTQKQLENSRGMKAALGILFSVGLRPCSGAVLVLALANVLGMIWAGIAAVAAMSCGTAITVIALATLTVKARHWVAARFKADQSRGHWGGGLVALAGGVIIFLLGISLLAASFGPPHPLRLS